MTLKYKLNCAAFGLRLNSLRAAKGAHEDLFYFYYLARRLAHALAENRRLKLLALRLQRRERARRWKLFKSPRLANAKA